VKKTKRVRFGLAFVLAVTGTVDHLLDRYNVKHYLAIAVVLNALLVWQNSLAAEVSHHEADVWVPDWVWWLPPDGA